MLARYHLILALWLWPIAAQAAETVVKHFDFAYSSALRPYLYEVLELVLELTEEEFGPYRIDTSQENLSAARAKLETEKGEILNVLFASGWDGQLVDSERVAGYRFGAFNDLLGLRSLLVLPENKIVTTPPANRADFLRYTAGLGYFWEDVGVLRGAGITVVEAHTYDALFPMLQKKRFDYLPLSVLEVEPALRSKERQFGQIMPHPDIELFYPMDFQLYVNKQTATLAERIGKGLKKAAGEPLQRVFEKHFSSVIPTGQTKKQLYIIDNHAISETLNKATIERFLGIYGEHFEVIE